jgi:hypothetical protein
MKFATEKLRSWHFVCDGNRQIACLMNRKVGVLAGVQKQGSKAMNKGLTFGAGLGIATRMKPRLVKKVGFEN